MVPAPTHLLTVLLAFLTFSVMAPQVFRCWRLRTTEGISGLSQTLCLSAAGAWFTYGVMERDPAQLVANGIDGLLILAVLVALCRYGTMRLRFLFVRLAVVVLGLIVLARVGGSAAVLMFGAGFVSIWQLPQVYLAWKFPGGRGLSVVSLTLCMSLNVAWFVYGFVVADYVVSASAAWAACTATFIAARTVIGRRRLTRMAHAEESVVAERLLAA